ncbi:MAG: tRNA lysidine(34) synthetase TilS [Halioglobus sp.]
MPHPLSPNSRFEQIIAARPGCARWYVAYSGGLDSTVLLHSLHLWCRENPQAPELVAWHVNHGMQASAEAFEQQCEQFCQQQGIPLQTFRVAVNPDGRGAESAAREARYGVFEQNLQPGEIMLLGHHLDDQIETFFLRLLRGAGLSGLSAMPASRKLGAGELQRPFLDVPRSVIEQYAEQQGLSYIEDPSNDDVSLDRNYLRQQLLPLVQQRWPGYRQTVNRAAGHMASALTLLEQQLPEAVELVSAMGDSGIPLRALTEEVVDIATMYLRAWLRDQGVAMPPTVAVEEFLSQLAGADTDAVPCLETKEFVLRRYGEAVYLLRPQETRPVLEGLSLTPGHPVDIAGVGVLSLVSGAGPGITLAADDVLELVWRRGGERCKPLGRAHSQTLKKLLQEKSVPPWWRDRIPLLLLNGEMVAVGDLWLCETTGVCRSGEADKTLWQVQWQRNTFAACD